MFISKNSIDIQMERRDTSLKYYYLNKLIVFKFAILNHTMRQIEKSTRLINYIIDSIFILLLFVIVNIFSFGNFIDVYVPFLITFFYYFIFESITGQTFGKLVTKTRVVQRNGMKAGIFKIFIRSFLRLVPIDNLSYLFGNEQGLHDIASMTRLKKVK